MLLKRAPGGARCIRPAGRLLPAVTETVTAPPPGAATDTQTIRERTREFSDDDARWGAVLRRDRRADGAFCYSVLTTGTYSRPSCGSRHARRTNTVFFPDPATAEHAGFRPCLRCRPDKAVHPDKTVRDTHTEAVVRACRLMEGQGPAPTLDELAEATGFSRFHFHRVFTSLTGVTPKAYAAACRADRLRRAMARTRTITEAIYEAGFNSSGNFYALAQNLLGMTPTLFKNGGRGVRVHYAFAECELGPLLVGGTSAGICSLQFGPDAGTLLRQLRNRFAEAELAPAEGHFRSRVAVALGEVTPLTAGRGVPRDIRSRALGKRLRTALNDAGTPAASVRREVREEYT